MNKEIEELAKKIAEQKLRREVERSVAKKFKKMILIVDKQIDLFLASKQFHDKIKKAINDDLTWRFENGLNDSFSQKDRARISRKIVSKIMKLL